MAASTNDTFWSFVHYVKNNRFKTVESMTEDDFDAMAEGFARENSTEIDGGAADDTAIDAAYPSIEWPGAITAYRNRATCDQADYPEGHFKKAKYGE